MNRNANAADQEQDATAPERSVAFYSAEEVAEMLGIHHADVIALVRSGDLAAKRVGPTVFITADQLTRFMARHDPRANVPRYTRGDVVVFMDKDGRGGFGRYVGEMPDGRVAVQRTGFWGDYQDAFPPEQVQPFTCRFPRTALN
jgi:excisionase family DNA binding protein